MIGYVIERLPTPPLSKPLEGLWRKDREGRQRWKTEREDREGRQRGKIEREDREGRHRGTKERVDREGRQRWKTEMEDMEEMKGEAKLNLTLKRRKAHIVGLDSRLTIKGYTGS